ncbi:hypothetical protein Tco_0927196 [Tanacetum coccineum]
MLQGNKLLALVKRRFIRGPTLGHQVQLPINHGQCATNCGKMQKAHPLSPAYVPDPIELDEHVPVYVPEPEHPEYHAPSDDDIQISRMSPYGEEDDDEDPEEDPSEEHEPKDDDDDDDTDDEDDGTH